MRQEMQERIYESPGIIKKKLRIAVMMLVLLILLAGAVFLYYHNPKRELMPACPIYYFTGYYCPGCGAGRACYAILHGQLYQAFRYNPVLVVLLPWLVLYYALCGIQWLIYGKERVSSHIPGWIPKVILMMLLLYGVIRNIEAYPFILLAPAAV